MRRMASLLTVPNNFLIPCRHKRFFKYKTVILNNQNFIQSFQHISDHGSQELFEVVSEDDEDIADYLRYINLQRRLHFVRVA